MTPSPFATQTHPLSSFSSNTPHMHMINNNPYKVIFPAKMPDSFRTGLVSPATNCSASTSVTPITPMTPLTTPRTPAQILLGRNEQQRGRRPHDGSSSSEAIADAPPHEAQAMRQQQLLAFEILTNFVDSLESSLLDVVDREYSGERVVGPGIMRMCRDLAERVDEAARELHSGVQPFGSDDWISQEPSGRERVVGKDRENNFAVARAMDEFAAVPFTEAGSSAASSEALPSLLADTAASLRAVTQEEAQELAEVALEVAIMAVSTLRVIQRNMSRMLKASEAGVDPPVSRGKPPHHVKNAVAVPPTGRNQLRVTWLQDQHVHSISADRSNQGLGPLVETLGEDEKKDENFNSSNGAIMSSAIGNFVGTPPKHFPPRYTPKLSPIPSSPSKTVSFTTTNHYQSIHRNNNFPSRRRVLWPPILPAIRQATQSCIHTAQHHPLPAVAVGLICGPAAVAAAVFAGPPVLITDWAIQSSYDAMSETPLVESVETAAADAFRVARLAALCAKLAIKRGASVGERQIRRRGGVAKIFSDVVDGAVDMALHPVETVGLAWEGLLWVGGVARDLVGFVGDAVAGGGGEMRMDIH
ncbi:hypothetical protein ACHAW6_015858 [Cyclotella cf. meneghiniana]